MVWKSKDKLNINREVFNNHECCFSERLNFIEWNNNNMSYDPIDLFSYHKRIQLQRSRNLANYKNKRTKLEA